MISSVFTLVEYVQEDQIEAYKRLNPNRHVTLMSFYAFIRMYILYLFHYKHAKHNTCTWFSSTTWNQKGIKS